MDFRKFENKIDVSDWLVETDNGYAPIKTIGKTVPYKVFEIKTNLGKRLRCADTHILFDSEWDEIYAKDLNKDTRPDKVQTVDGVETIESVVETCDVENMFDLEVDSNEHRYYTNGLLSHNSIFLCNDAANFMRAGKNVLFVTCEMSDKKVIKRIGANVLDIDLKDYDSISNDDERMGKRLQEFRRKQLIPLGRLFIKEYPTSCCTTIDLENHIKQIEDTEGFKIHVVVIDYINIMRNYRNPNSENTYMNIKQIAEDLRAIATRRNCLILTATQSTRSAFDSSDITLSQVAESMGLVATADTVYGIIQDDEQKMNYEYFLKMLKIRDGFGKNSKMKLNIDYPKMRLTEDGMIINEDGSSSLSDSKPTTKIKTKKIEPVKKIEPNRDKWETHKDVDENFGGGRIKVRDIRELKKEKKSGEPSQGDMPF